MDELLKGFRNFQSRGKTAAEQAGLFNFNFLLVLVVSLNKLKLE